MMTINFDTITNNYEVIYVIKTVMKYYLKKNRYEFIFITVFQIWFNVYLLTSLHDAIWFMNIHIARNHGWFSPMISGYVLKSKFSLSRHFEYANEQITYHFWL